MSGMPLLSQPPPNNGADALACRRCSKEFSFLFNRHRRCNHCGYAYCTSCTDFQALMPRPGPDSGYKSLPVCSYCMDMLTITASSKNRLRSLPLSTLRSYMNSYNIRTSGAALEKDDLVEAILRAKGSNGCLLPAHEDYYRKNSVPQKSTERTRPRSIFSRTSREEAPAPIPEPQQRYHGPSPGAAPPHTHPPPPQHPYQQQHRPDPPSPQMPFQQQRPSRTNQYFASHPSNSAHTHPSSSYVRPSASHSSPNPAQTHTSSSYVRPSASHSSPNSAHTYASSSHVRPSASQANFHTRAPGGYRTDTQSHMRQPPSRPRSAAPTVPPTRSPAPPPPVPSLDSLLRMTPDDITHLSIATLKSVLYENRVSTSLGVLEKQDLVSKVLTLVRNERLDKEMKEREEREEAERMEWARREREREEEKRKAAERERKLMEEHQGESGRGSIVDDPKPASSPSPSFSDRLHDGLCVICQDEHANMAIIDCGHLALCKGCSETVMKTTRECPLCRTRIITEQRLLRIFKG